MFPYDVYYVASSMLSMLYHVILILFVDVCCMFVVILMIVTILYHSYHFCPNYGHSHLLLETMVTVSMIIWAEDFLQVMVIIGVSEDPPKSQIYFLEIIEID